MKEKEMISPGITIIISFAIWISFLGIAKIILMIIERGI